MCSWHEQGRKRTFELSSCSSRRFAKCRAHFPRYEFAKCRSHFPSSVREDSFWNFCKTLLAVDSSSSTYLLTSCSVFPAFLWLQDGMFQHTIRSFPLPINTHPKSLPSTISFSFCNFSLSLCTLCEREKERKGITSQAPFLFPLFLFLLLARKK